MRIEGGNQIETSGLRHVRRQKVIVNASAVGRFEGAFKYRNRKPSLGRLEEQGSNNMRRTVTPSLIALVLVIVLALTATGCNGEPGDRGPVGEQGPAGPLGPGGPAGPSGDPGLQGMSGIQGPSGPPGTQGVPGAAGPMGPEGPEGPSGATGPQGSPGAPGALGATGAQGPMGLKGEQGARGPTGPQGTITAILSGTVTNALTKRGIASLSIETDPPIGVSIVTNKNGTYATELPVGTYSLTYSPENYEPSVASVTLVAGQPIDKDIALQPSTPVVVSAGADTGGSPGDTLSFQSTVTPMDGSTVQTVAWAQASGAPAILTNADGANVSVTLGNAAAYQAELFRNLESPDRFMVQGISPWSLELAEDAVFRVTVTTDSGSYSDTVHVSANLPYAVNGGLQNVPIGKTVLLRGKTQPAYSWRLTAPAGSSAVVSDSTANTHGSCPMSMASTQSRNRQAAQASVSTQGHG